MGEEEKVPFKATLKGLTEQLPVPQLLLMKTILPNILASAKKFEKFQQIHARPATPKEVVVSITADGEETTNTASAGDYVVKNLTKAAERYLVSEEKFEARYQYVSDLEDGWKLYDPIGEVYAIEITREITSELTVGEEFYIMPSWNSEQFAQEGDLLVSPLPSLDEVYRIARAEFEETYRSADRDSTSG